MQLPKVKISQFYGIELNSFAVKVLKVSFLLAELQLTGQIVDINDLEKHILTANALRMDWNTLLPNKDCNYIISNPPFVGAMHMDCDQKAETRCIFKKVKGAGEFDYVTAWYKVACDYIKDLDTKVAFVSTSSICQGEHVTNFWKFILTNYNVEIDFAYKTFAWSSALKNSSNVHCVIVGFSNKKLRKEKIIYDNSEKFKKCVNINPYLMDAPTEFIEARATPICNVPKMKFGNMPRDGGNFILTPEDKNLFIKKEPLTKKYIRPYIGAREFINGLERYCIWLKDADLHEISKSKLILKRILAVKKFRESSKAAGTRRYASIPTRFCHISQPSTDYLLVPSINTIKREYIPIGFVEKNAITSNLVYSIESATFYHFGILASSVHMAWMRTVCGRLGNAYRYSKDIVYNTFPWPNPTDEQKSRIEKTAQGILDARNLYKDCTLAQLYSPLTMPSELRKAHKLNDEAVLKAFGFSKNAKEEEIVAKLMEMYKKLIDKENT